jgi:hypothetical protein
MRAIRRIRVFGLPGIKDTKFDDNEMIFEDTEFPDHLANYDIVIYCTGAFKHKYEQSFLARHLATITAGAIRRENEICSALERGRIVCFIGSHDQDYVTSGILKSYNIQTYVLDQGEVFQKLATKKSEFKSFIDDLGATQIGFSKAEIDDTICSINGDLVVGFSKRVGRGLLLSIPCVWGSKEIGYIVDHLKELAIGLISYAARMMLEPPSYLADFQFTNEKTALDKINRIEREEIAPLKERTRYYDKMKSILWLGNKGLERATAEFLGNLGLQTCADEICEEDLWIVDEKEKLVIIEVKSMNKNLTRQDISKLDEHREAREMPNLTGLLIANTFIVADSLESKDQPFAPNVVEKAVKTNLLITRTLDLCRIYDHLEDSGIQRSNILLKAIIGKNGWLTFQDHEIKIMSS